MRSPTVPLAIISLLIDFIGFPSTWTINKRWENIEAEMISNNWTKISWNIYYWLIRNSIIIWMASKDLTKYLFILMPAPLWHLICTNFLRLCRKYTFLMPFGTYLNSIWCISIIIFKQIDAVTASFKGAFWDKFRFRGQHKHSRYQSINKSTIFNAQLQLFLGKYYFN